MKHDMNLIASPIMDYKHIEFEQVVFHLNQINGNKQKRFWLQKAYEYIETTIRPVYSLDEFQPASLTMQKKRGSCSQRLACLETLARAHRIPTRVRGLWIQGEFWYPRFALTKHFIPKKILLAWPQFYLEDEKFWMDVDELFMTTQEMTSQSKLGFTNEGETLFDALKHMPIDFLGKSKKCVGLCGPANFDLSKFVLSEEGFFNTRDELFMKFYDLNLSWRGKAFKIFYGDRKSS